MVYVWLVVESWNGQFPYLHVSVTQCVCVCVCVCVCACSRMGVFQRELSSAVDEILSELGHSRDSAARNMAAASPAMTSSATPPLVVPWRHRRSLVTWSCTDRRHNNNLHRTIDCLLWPFKEIAMFVVLNAMWVSRHRKWCLGLGDFEI